MTATRLQDLETVEETEWTSKIADRGGGHTGPVSER